MEMGAISSAVWLGSGASALALGTLAYLWPSRRKRSTERRLLEDIAEGRYQLAIPSLPVSYTHLTLPTICSV